MKKKRTKRNRNGTINKGLEFPSGEHSAGQSENGKENVWQWEQVQQWLSRLLEA